MAPTSQMGRVPPIPTKDRKADVDSADERAQHSAYTLLAADETVHTVANATSASVMVTDRRLAVAAGDRLTLDIGFDGLRRIQFDIERDRPATLVIVPESPTHEPQVLAIPPERYDEITGALAIIGRRLAGLN
jgi:hypothetical protein